MLLAWLTHQMDANKEDAGQFQFKFSFATYLGGSEYEQAREVILYPDGSVLIGAQTMSSDMPTTPGVVQPKYAGDDPSLGHPGIYGGDCYLAKLSHDGREILCATYFGGSKQERNVYGMALDKDGNIVITTATRSSDLPTTNGCLQPNYGGGLADWMVAKISPDMRRILWCTYIGGSDDESPRGGLDLDDKGDIYIVGTTNSPDFPVTAGVFQTARKGRYDAAIVKLHADGTLVWSTLLGGSSSEGIIGIRVNSKGEAYVGGHTESADFPVTPNALQVRHGGQSDCFIAKLSHDASRLLFSTLLGGRIQEFAEHRLLLVHGESVLLTGFTSSPNFPTTEGTFQRVLKGKSDGFLAKLSADLGNLIFSTLLGGSGGEFWLMPTLDEKGNIYIVGQTDSTDFPVTTNALQKRYGGGASDGALAIFSSEGSKLLYATYLGGSGEDIIRSIAIGQNGEIFLVGSTSSKDFPVTANAFQTKLRGKTDAFVVKLLGVNINK